jgi:hypothetical protein
VLTPYPLVPSVPWRLVLRTPHGLASRRLTQEQLLAQLTVELARGQVEAMAERVG